MQTDIEIAQLAEMRKISDIAKTRLEIPENVTCPDIFGPR
jgi:hypothetical protein